MYTIKFKDSHEVQAELDNQQSLLVRLNDQVRFEACHWSYSQMKDQATKITNTKHRISFLEKLLQ